MKKVKRTPEQIAAMKARINGNMDLIVAGMSRQAELARAGEFNRPVRETREQRANYAEDVAGDYELAEAIRTGRA